MRAARAALGFVLLLGAVTASCQVTGAGNPWGIALVALASWILSVGITDKYVHKYPQRPLSYLLASHTKAAVAMALFLAAFGLPLGSALCPQNAVWAAFLLFSLSDGLVSLFWPGARSTGAAATPAGTPSPAAAQESGPHSEEGIRTSPSGSAADLLDVCATLEKPLVEFLEANLPEVHRMRCEVLQAEGAPVAEGPSGASVECLIAPRVPFNDVRRLSRFFRACTDRVAPGGHFVGRYVPLEAEKVLLRHRTGNALYLPVAGIRFLWRRVCPKLPYLNRAYFFLTRGRGRVVSKTEIWGRLESCGLRVIAESAGEGERFLIARRVPAPPQVKRPSYYPIIALERVGLGGSIILAHKVRTMYPFSEYIQKRVFELNSMGATGKAADDFRITEYGRFLRKYWLDEIPQIWDWLRGDIKLVGLRAMSRHYFSLYPKEVQELYLQVKPGLIPPIFGESTQGFEQIVEVDAQYLRCYLAAPVRADIRYFFRTFYDIVFRGVRSH